MRCPCGSEEYFRSCCEIIHHNLFRAETAEQLMRARYTAFAVGNIDFIYNSFYPTARRFQSKQEIKSWANQNKWIQLEILNSTRTTVEFKAHYLDQNFNLNIHHEKSTFKKVQHIWYYAEGMLTK